MIVVIPFLHGSKDISGWFRGWTKLFQGGYKRSSMKSTAILEINQICFPSAASKTPGRAQPLFRKPDSPRFRPAETLALLRKKPPKMGGF